MGTRRLTLISVVLLALTAACATGANGTSGPGSTPGTGGPAPAPTGSATSPPVEDVPLPPPTRAHRPTPGDVTVTGNVVDGVEAGCKLLQTGSETYLLITKPEHQVQVGARVLVTGRVQPDLVTTCMQGVPLVVSSVKPA